MKTRGLLASAALAAWLVFPSQAEERLPLDSLMLSLLQVQDRIAAGDAAAIPLQSHLMKMLDASIAESGDKKEISDSDFQVMLIFGIVGTGSNAVADALAEIKEPEERVALALAVLDYRKRRRNQAAKRFVSLNPDDIRGRLKPFLAFAKGNLFSRGNPKRAIKEYNMARLAAPGTLLEEATLRRLMAIHMAQREGQMFFSAAKQYARRFIDSPYRQQYMSMLQRGVLNMRRSISLEDLKELGDSMPPVYAAAFHMHLVRAAVVSGLMKLASFSVDEVIALAEKSDDVRVNQAQLALLKLLSGLQKDNPRKLARELDRVDTAHLAPDDVKLLKTAKNVLASVLAPVDDLMTNSVNTQEMEMKEPKTEMAKTSSEGDASSSQTMSDKTAKKSNDDELDGFIESTQDRLKAIDNLLSE